MVIPGERPFFPHEAGKRGPPDSLVRILVVDDEPSLRRSVVALLHSSDRLIEDCGSVAEALARLVAGKFDLLIIDYRLPDATGLAIMNWLTSYNRPESVIVISGEDSMEAAISALRRGALDFLRKPYDPEQLRRAVTAALSRRQQERNNRSVLQRLQASEQMHRYMVESSRDLIFTITPEGRFTYLNPRVESLLGYRGSALIGQHFSEIVHPEDLDRSRQAFFERRTGARASSNVELRLNRSLYGQDGEGENGPVQIVLNTMGIYNQTEEEAGVHYAGTYGVARTSESCTTRLLPTLATSYHDPLTQLPSRELFRDRLGLAIAQAKRRKGQIAVMFIEMDRSRLGGDSPDQGEGDALLRAAAQRLKKCLRRGDTLTRHGSDEFTILLPDARGRDDASAIASKILDAFQTPFTQHGGPFPISLGIALHPEDGDCAESLTQHAAIAMHQVKRSGGRSHAFFAPEMHAVYRNRISLEAELCQALSRNQLELHYQPLVSLSRNCVTGMEALIRWQHPAHGLISPSRFIQLAEDAGIIHDISRWVLETGCAQLATWRRQHPNLRLAINLSLRDFDRADLADTIYQVLARNGLPPDSLEIEVTESLMLGQVEQIRAKVQSLRDIGVGLAIDDFGTGYSSLAYLQDFAVTRLKIDRSFVRAINARGSHPVIHAIAGIARGFDIQIAAEGVERGDQVSALESMGCDEMQGFYFSRPVSAHGAGALLRDFRPASLNWKMQGEPLAV